MDKVEIQQVTAGRGADWLSQSWPMFKQAPGVWIGIIVVWVLIAIVADFIPVIGSLAMSLAGPVFTAGVCLGCRSLESGQGLRLGHLFEGFTGDRVGPLITVGALGLAGGAALVLVAVVLGAGAMLTGAPMAHGEGHMGGGMLLTMLFIVALAVPLAMALWFAAPLVALDGVAPVDSLKLSFSACLRNFVPLLVWSLLAFVLMLVAAIPLLLGWLVAMPMLMASYYRMYRDVFAATPQAT